MSYSIRFKWALITALVGVLLLMIFDSLAAAALPQTQWTPPLWLSIGSREQKVEKLAKVIDCQVRQQGERTYAARAHWYDKEQLQEYASAMLDAVEVQRWPQVRIRRAGWADIEMGHKLLLIASIVKQQSNYVVDAVSEWNRDAKGNRIRVNKRLAWRKPDHRLDYGLMQMHWNTMRQWRPEYTLQDLKDPRKNLMIGAMWAAERSRRCADYINGRTPRCRCPRRLMKRGHWYSVRAKCPKDESDSLTCRCLMSWRIVGVPIFTGLKSTWSLLGEFVPLTKECFNSVDSPGKVAEDEEDSDADRS